MMEELRAFAVYTKVVEAGSFRGAAKVLGLSPSVVSQHISNLEARLKVQLLYRSTRRLALTPAGERLFEVASTIVASAEGAMQELSEESDAPAGRIRMTAPIALAYSPIVALLAGFAEAHPRVDLTLSFNDQVQDLLAEGFDCAIRMNPLAQVGFEERQLCVIQRILVASPGYSGRHPRPKEPSDLKAWRWLHYAPRARQIEMSHPHKGSASIWGYDQISVDSSEAMRVLAVAGAGLCRLPDYMTEADIAAGKLIQILPDWTLQPLGIYFIWPPNARRIGLTMRLLDFLAATTKDWPDDHVRWSGA